MEKAAPLKGGEDEGSTTRRTAPPTKGERGKAPALKRRMRSSRTTQKEEGIKQHLTWKEGGHKKKGTKGGNPQGGRLHRKEGGTKAAPHKKERGRKQQHAKDEGKISTTQKVMEGRHHLPKVEEKAAPLHRWKAAPQRGRAQATPPVGRSDKKYKTGDNQDGKYRKM